MSPSARLEELAATYLALLDNVATFLLTFALVYAVGRLLVVPLASYAMDRRGIDRTLHRGLERALSASVLALAVVIGLVVAGLDVLLDRAAILVAALTVALGFAAQNVIGNFVSGIFIVTDPVFNIGDWIRWNDQEGVIEDISFRSTRVRTFDNEVVTVPNSELTTNAVTNAVLYDALRLELAVEVNYDDDLETAIAVLESAAASRPDVLDDPAPVVVVTDLGEAIRLSARFWIADPDRQAFARIRSGYAEEVVRRFEEAGIDLGRANPQALEGEIGVVSRSSEAENRTRDDRT